MSYIINRYDVNTIGGNAASNITGWSKYLQTLEIKLKEFTEDPGLVGSGADAMKQFIQQVHLTTLSMVISALQLYSEAVVGYAAGFSEFGLDYANGQGCRIGDTDILTEDHFPEITKELDDAVTHIQDLTPRAKEVITSVSDLVPDINIQSADVYTAPLEDQSRCIKKLSEDVGNYDAAFANDALVMIKDLIVEARAFAEKVIAAGQTSFDPAKTDAFFDGVDGRALAEKIILARATVQGNVKMLQNGVQYINGVYKERAEDAKERARTNRINNGIKLTGASVIGIAAAVLSCGSAIPEELVAYSVIINGILLTVNVSGLVEGVQEIYLGASGDIDTPAYNLFRDGGFDGDQDKYDLFVASVEGLNTYVGAAGNIITAGELGMNVMAVTAVEEAGSVWAGVLIDEGMGNLSAQIGDMDPITQLAVEEGLGFLLNKGSDAAIHGVGNAVFLRPGSAEAFVPPKFEELTDDEVKALAIEAMKGSADADAIVIGKHNFEGVDYQTIARKYYEEYFNLDCWDEKAETYSGTQMWRINQKYLEMQIAAGKEIYLSHDPDGFRTQYTNGFAREIAYLEAKGYTFEKMELRKGNTTDVVYHAVKK